MSEEIMNQKLCSGYGQYYSTTSGDQYVGITLREIEEMTNNPCAVEKHKAQWTLMSSLLTRVHEDQLNNGLFWALWFDADNANGIDFRINFSRAVTILKCYTIGYTSRSATKENQKYRLIIPLAISVDGFKWKMLSRILNDKLSTLTEPDPASERTGQLCYLANRGEFYDHAIHSAPLLHPDDWSEEIEAERQRLLEVAEQQDRAREAARLKAVERMRTGMVSPVTAYNSAYDLEMVMEQYGYLRRGNRWLSPNSGSGQAGVEIKDGRKWFSAHASDSGIGKPTANGSMGDAFDLFAYYEHGNDWSSALRAAGDMFTTDNGETLTKASQREYMQRQAAKKAMDGFEDLTRNDPSDPGQPPPDAPGDPGPAGSNSAAPRTDNGTKPKNGSVFRFVSLSDMPLIPPQMIMPPLLEDDALIQLFGESSAGKTFFTADLAFSIASKTPFHGLNIRKSGHIIYQLGEGISGFRRRARAWEIVRGVDLTTAPISVSTRPLGLIDKGAAETMCQAVEQASAIHGPPVLLIVDTLARNFGAGDESSTKDMNAFVAVMDMIRTRYGCSILLVHHPGHGDKNRGRGAYSLPAAIDANLRLEKDPEGLIRLEAVKMKEAEIPPPLAFRLASVDLGMVDEEGQPVTSAVLRSVEYTPRCTETKAGNGKNQKIALETLRRIQRSGNRTALDAWRAALRADGMQAPRAREATQSLIDAGRVYLTKDGWVHATGDD